MVHHADVADVEASQPADLMVITPTVCSYPAIEKVLQYHLSVQGNERRQKVLSCKPHVQKQQDHIKRPATQTQQLSLDNPDECSFNTSAAHDREANPCDDLARHMYFIRCRYQERKHTTSMATKTVCKIQPSKQQMWQEQLLGLKYRRLLSAWNQVAKANQRKHLQLLSWQKAFQATAQDIWHAQGMGFNAVVISHAEGPYGLAAAFYAWRRRGAVLYVWALLVLGCNTASPVTETTAVQSFSSDD